MQSSALWLPFDFVRCVHSPTISLDGFAWWHLASPSTSPVACIHFQCLRHAAAQLHLVSFISDNLPHSSYPSRSVSLLHSDLPSTCSPSFRIFGASTSMDFLRKQCRRLRISFAFDLFGCVHSPTISLALSPSPTCNLTDFNKLLRIHFRILPHLLVSLPFQPPAPYRIVRLSMSSASLN
jgi:hypothetical protein